MAELAEEDKSAEVFMDLARRHIDAHPEAIGLLYVGVSTIDQNTDRQLEGIELDKIFIDKASGKDNHREQLSTITDLPG